MEINLSQEYVKKLLDYLPIWTVISFITLILGYIGFFTYCSLNNIPYNLPNIYTLIGIGILNLVFWLLVIIAAIKGYYWKSFRALTVMGALYWLTIDPKIWGIIAIGYLLLYSESVWNIFLPRKIDESNAEPKPKPEKTITIGKHRFYLILDLILNISIIVLGWYFNSRIYIIFLFAYYLIEEVKYTIQTRVLKSYHLFIFIVLGPSFISYSLLDKLNYSLIGISKSKVDVHYNDSIVYHGYIVYQDSENLYLKDSLNSKETIIAPKGTVSSIYVHEKIAEFTIKERQPKHQMKNHNPDTLTNQPQDLPLPVDSIEVDSIN